MMLILTDFADPGDQCTFTSGSDQSLARKLVANATHFNCWLVMDLTPHTNFLTLNTTILHDQSSCL